MTVAPIDDVNDGYIGELNEDDIRDVIAKMWILHLSERDWLDQIYEFTKGLRGRPVVPKGSSQEVRDLAKLSVKNVLGLVRDAFAQNLSVVGYRTADAQENSPAWATWQRNRMDARQAEVHRPALTYGVSYVTVMPEAGGPVFRARSPRQMLAVYDDPTLDAWPQYALETWVTNKDAKRQRRGLLYDDTYVYELNLGWLSPTDAITPRANQPISVESVDDVIAHGATYDGVPVCPVVRFVNARDADDMIVGEVAPLIQDQQAINNVNFDRLLVSRFGAFPQRVITGWQGTKAELTRGSVSRVWTFEDETVGVHAFPAASTDPYNNMLEEMLQFVAMKAQISPAYVTGKMVNLSAEALAAAEANEQRKLAAKRESFGESWEQVLRLAAEMAGDEATADDSGAEVVWRDTEARAFGAVVDGVVKLASAGVPIEELLTAIPNLSQAQIESIRDKIQLGRVSSLVDKLTSTGTNEVPPPPDNAADKAVSAHELSGS